MTALVSACELSQADQLVPQILPWLHEAGNPYFDFLFGGSDAARTVLDRWMRRASSEVFFSRAVLLTAGGRPVAGFIALTGAELNACRRSDLAALAMSGGRRQREEILGRLALVHDLFPAVGEQDLYLSKIWVESQYRGAGFARELMTAYLAAGRARGCARFRLDVCAENQRAIRMYRSFGFTDLRQSAAPGTGLRYLAMTAKVTS